MGNNINEYTGHLIRHEPSNKNAMIGFYNQGDGYCEAEVFFEDGTRYYGRFVFEDFEIVAYTYKLKKIIDKIMNRMRISANQNPRKY